MSQIELQRLKVIENVVEGRLTVGAGAELLQLSPRQVKRLKRLHDPKNPEWVHHGNAGRKPPNAVPEALRHQIVELASGKYAGFNDTHLHDRLEAEGIGISRQSVAGFCGAPR